MSVKPLWHQVDVCCQFLIAESTEGVPIGFFQPPAWLPSACSWSLMVDYDREVVTPTRSSSTLHEKSNSRLGWVIVRSIAV